MASPTPKTNGPTTVPDSSLTLSLRSWPTSSSTPDSLSNLIQRMQNQRGHFRNIKEAALEQEIRDGKDDGDAMEGVEAADEQKAQAGEDAEDEEGEGKKGTLKHLAAKKRELATVLHTAWNEAYMMVDLISLLESRYAPKQAALTMSQYSTNTFGMGTVSYERWDPSTSQRQPAQGESDTQIAQGVRLEGLRNAADQLCTAAQRLETEMGREGRYWRQLLRVKEKGWVVFRHPRERTRLVVQVAGTDAGSLFREKGLLSLIGTEDGSAKLQGGAIGENKILRVRVKKGDEIVAESTIGHKRKLDRLDPAGNDADETPQEELLLQARNSLFEEELYHEIAIEGRSLLNMDVRSCQGVVSLPIRPPQELGIQAIGDEILIDLVPEDYSVVPQPEQSNPGFYLAHSINHALHALLSKTHRQRFLRRTRLPAPLSEKMSRAPPALIIRPLMRILQHEIIFLSIRHKLTQLLSVLLSAGLSCTLDVVSRAESKQFTKWTPASPHGVPRPGQQTGGPASSMQDVPRTDPLVRPFIAPVVSTFTITLPSIAETQQPTSATIAEDIKLSATAPSEQQPSPEIFKISLLTLPTAPNVGEPPSPTAPFINSYLLSLPPATFRLLFPHHLVAAPVILPSLTNPHQAYPASTTPPLPHTTLASLDRSLRRALEVSLAHGVLAELGRTKGWTAVSSNAEIGGVGVSTEGALSARKSVDLRVGVRIFPLRDGERGGESAVSEADDGAWKEWVGEGVKRVVGAGTEDDFSEERSGIREAVDVGLEIYRRRVGVDKGSAWVRWDGNSGRRKFKEVVEGWIGVESDENDMDLF